MIVTRKIIQLGKSSLAITLPKEIASKVSRGDNVVLSISLLELIKAEPIEYRCLVCEHRFTQSNDEPYEAYCPACGEDDVEEFDINTTERRQYK